MAKYSEYFAIFFADRAAAQRPDTVSIFDAGCFRLGSRVRFLCKEI